VLSNGWEQGLNLAFLHIAHQIIIAWSGATAMHQSNRAECSNIHFGTKH